MELSFNYDRIESKSASQRLISAPAGGQIGKIARLPRAVREQLNERLENGEQGATLLDWLNGLSETQALLAAEFAGAPINKQNLSRWRRTGFRDWQMRQEARAIAGGITSAPDGTNLTAGTEEGDASPVTEVLGKWLATRYALTAARLAPSGIETGGRSAVGEQNWRMLRDMCSDVVQLRRQEQRAQRIELDTMEQAMANRRTSRGRAVRSTEDAAWQGTLAAGLERLRPFLVDHPEARAAFDDVVHLVEEQQQQQPGAAAAAAVSSSSPAVRVNAGQL